MPGSQKGLGVCSVPHRFPGFWEETEHVDTRGLFCGWNSLVPA